MYVRFASSVDWVDRNLAPARKKAAGADVFYPTRTHRVVRRVNGGNFGVELRVGFRNLLRDAPPPTCRRSDRCGFSHSLVRGARISVTVFLADITIRLVNNKIVIFHLVQQHLSPFRLGR